MAIQQRGQSKYLVVENVETFELDQESLAIYTSEGCHPEDIDPYFLVVVLVRWFYFAGSTSTW